MKSTKHLGEHNREWVLANKNGENNKDEDNHTSDRSTRSEITTGSDKTSSRESGSYGDGNTADQRESPTVKYGVWYCIFLQR